MSNKKKFLVLIIFLIIPISSFLVSTLYFSDFDSIQAIEDDDPCIGLDIDFDSSGNKYILVDKTTSSDLYLQKFDPSGEEVFEKKITKYPWFSKLKINEEDEILISSSKGNDMYFCKYSNSGEKIMSDDVNESGDVYSTGIDYNSEGDIFLAGYSYDIVGGEANSHILRVDDDDLEIEYTTESSSNKSTHFLDLAIDSQDNIYVVGVYDEEEITLMKFNSKGTKVEWKERIDAEGAATSLIIDNDDNVIFSGFAENDLFLAKYNSDGDEIWTNTAYKDSIGYALTLDFLGNIFVTGWSSEDIDAPIEPRPYPLDECAFFLIKFDAQGNPIWKKTYDEYELNAGLGIVNHGHQIFITGFVAEEDKSKSRELLSVVSSITSATTLSWILILSAVIAEISICILLIKIRKRASKQPKQPTETKQSKTKELKAKDIERIKISQELKEKFPEIENMIENHKFKDSQTKLNDIVKIAKENKLNNITNRCYELIEVLEETATTVMIKRLLEYQFQTKKDLIKTEIVKKLNFSIDDATKYLVVLNSKVNYKKSERNELKNLAEKAIKQFGEPTLYDLMITLNFNFKTAKKVVKYFLDEGLVSNIPNIPPEQKKDKPKQPVPAKFNIDKIGILRGGDWQVVGNQSIFYYKVKVENKSQFVVTNIQILLTSIPKGLEIQSDRYKIESLKPNAFESPTFKLQAKESCVGDIVEGLISFTDPKGKPHTIHIEPFEICYVCNLLVPKDISKQDFDRKTEFMQEKRLTIESNLEMDELEYKIENIVKKCNFSLLQSIQENKSEDFKKFEAFAEGLYDKQDVALSVAVQKIEDGSQLVVKAMSDKVEKVTDILKDFNVKLDDIKSDTEMIKEYSSQIEELFDKTDNLEEFLRDHLSSDFEKIKDSWKDYKEGKINKKELIKQGLKIIGKKFIYKLIGKITPI